MTEPAGGGTVLVAGAGGVIGRYAAAEYAARPGWDVLAVSRREPPAPPTGSWKHLPVDLSDRTRTLTGLRPAAQATHLVFAAYAEQGSLAGQIAPNVALLRNTLDALAENDAPLRHVTLYQGGKAYGAHLGRFKTPAKETDPRLLGPNFYYDQEDVLREIAAERGFTFTILRPEAVIGYATGNPMNLLMVIAIYAAISKESGLPLRFPGSQETYDALYNVTDAELLARAAVWSGSSSNAEGEIFNVTNGDYFRWRHLWPAFARYFGMEYAEPQHISLAEHLADKEPVWQRLAQRHGLVSTPYSDLVKWSFGDFIFGAGVDNICSTVKIRQAGFADCYDSEQRFLDLFDQLRDQHVIPHAV